MSERVNERFMEMTIGAMMYIQEVRVNNRTKGGQSITSSGP